jgi:hypothetical protein
MNPSKPTQRSRGVNVPYDSKTQKFVPFSPASNDFAIEVKVR